MPTSILLMPTQLGEVLQSEVVTNQKKDSGAALVMV